MTLRSLFAGAAVLSAMATSSLASAQSANKASHVDFDDQLVQGQVNKGAVHLIERKDSDLGSLVKVRTSYRKEILAGSDAETASVPAVLVAAIPTAPAAMMKNDSAKSDAVVAPASAPAPVPAVKAAPAKSAPAPVKKPEAKKSSNSVKSVGGSRAISRR